MINLDSEQVRQFCKKNYIRRLSLFGSFLHGRERPESDVDILVEFVPGHEPGWDFFELQYQLSAIVGRPVDLHTPNFLSRYFRDKILHEAKVYHDE